jgi:hypothetical protein
MPRMTPAALVTRSALFTYLSPRLAEDGALNFDTLVRGVTSKNYRAKRDAIQQAVTQATRGKLAQDADIQDLANLLDALSPSVGQADAQVMPNAGPPVQGMQQGPAPAMQGGPPPMQTPPNSGPPMAAQKGEGQDDEKSDVVAKIKAYLEEEGVSPEILQNLDAFLAEEGNPKPDVGDPSAPPPNGGSAPPDDNDQPPSGDNDMAGFDEDALAGPTAIGGLDEDDMDEEERKRREAEDEVVPNEQKDVTASDSKLVTRAAMDAAIRKAQADAIQTQKQVREAERFVRPWVGELAMDAAHPDEVFRAALKAIGVAGADKMHRDALRPVLSAQPRPGSAVQGNGGRRVMATDAKPEGSFHDRFPDAKNITVQ